MLLGDGVEDLVELGGLGGDELSVVEVLVDPHSEVASI